MPRRIVGLRVDADELAGFLTGSPSLPVRALVELPDGGEIWLDLVQVEVMAVNGPAVPLYDDEGMFSGFRIEDAPREDT